MEYILQPMWHLEKKYDMGNRVNISSFTKLRYPYLAKSEMPQCPFCPYLAPSPHLLLTHLRIHSVKFLCYFCLKTFPTNRELVEHEKHNHPGPTYQCGSCTGQPSGQGDPRHHEDHPVILAPPHHTVQAHLNARRSFQVDFWGQEIHCTSNIP